MQATVACTPTPTVTIAPWFNPEYYAYYWAGLEEVYGPDALRIDSKPFPAASDARFHQHRDTFAFVVNGERFFVSANDHKDVPPGAFEWATVVGSVNLPSQADLPAACARSVVPLGPSFGIRSWDTIAATRMAARFLRFPHPSVIGPRALAATLRRQRRRLPIEAYTASVPAAGGRIWYLGTYWAAHPEANRDRVTFLRAARTVLGGGAVGGGLVARGGPLPSDLHDLSAAPVRSHDYVLGVRSSAVVFNHPAVHGCLGWKLGEFLALGKAIITTVIDGRLPAPLVHRRHCHVVDGTPTATAEAIEEVCTDHGYRRELEMGARTYYETHVAPAAAIRRLQSASSG